MAMRMRWTATGKAMTSRRQTCRTSFIRHVILRTTGKVRSVDWATNHGQKDLQLIVGTTNNQLGNVQRHV